MSGRRFLGRDPGIAHWAKVFDAGDALEVDEYGLPDVRRRRVPYAEVLAVTLYRYRMSGCLTLVGLLASGFSAAAVIVGAFEPAAGVAIFLVYALVPTLVFFVRLSTGVEVVTVHGRRTHARMRFYFMKDRAREVYEEIAAKASGKAEAPTS